MSESSESIYSEWLDEYCAQNSDPFVLGSHEMISSCLDLEKDTPNEYGWKYSSEQSFKVQISKAVGCQEMNSVYWTDMARNLEAYSLMTLWRGLELIRSCLNGLNKKETISPAIAARSLLELSTVFLLNANSLESLFSKLKFKKDTVITSTDAESLIVKMIWGTRYNNPEPHLLQTNIMTALQKLAKSPGAENLMKVYEFLCDIAHPSYIGNTSYWSHIQETYPDESEHRVISRLLDRVVNVEILDKTIWALAWSSFCIRSSFLMISLANKNLLAELSKNEK